MNTPEEKFNRSMTAGLEAASKAAKIYLDYYHLNVSKPRLAAAIQEHVSANLEAALLDAADKIDDGAPIWIARIAFGIWMVEAGIMAAREASGQAEASLSMSISFGA